jgi:hypothetical protein
VKASLGEGSSREEFQSDKFEPKVRVRGELPEDVLEIS